MTDDGSPTLVFEFSQNSSTRASTVTAKIGDDVIGVDRFDVERTAARRKFADEICRQRPGLSRDEIERVLLADAAEHARRAAADKEKQPEPEPDELVMKMPQHVRDEAREILEGPNLLKAIIDDVAACGVAGERELIAAIYLVGVSRLLSRPLAAIVQAPSSTGKSYVVEKTAAMFPLEAVIHATAMTAQSLYYLEPGELKNKFVVAGERSRKEDDETAEATRALREMIGSGRLTKLVPMKEGGRIVTQRIEQPGPISYVETTTLTKVFEEDANRCLLLSADERQQQTKLIVNQIAASYAGADGLNADAIVQRHHALQRMLQKRPVAIPFADRVAERFDCERVEARRAIGHVMSMIGALTLLHQFQRKIDGDGRIVADEFDYVAARGLCGGPLARLLGGRVSDAALRFHDRLTGRADGTFSTTKAAKQDRKASQTVRDWLRELAEAGAVEQVEPAKGSRPATWRMTGLDRDELVSDCGLPLTING